jgi:hypothetical protein
MEISAQKVPIEIIMNEGVDIETVIKGINHIGGLSEELVRRMFNYEEYINWREFLRIMNAVSGSTL